MKWKILALCTEYMAGLCIHHCAVLFAALINSDRATKAHQAQKFWIKETKKAEHKYSILWDDLVV